MAMWSATQRSSMPAASAARAQASSVAGRDCGPMLRRNNPVRIQSQFDVVRPMSTPGGRAMIYVAAAIAGMVAAVVGWFVVGIATLWIAGLYGMSDFEGGRSMFAFLAVAPIAGLVSMVVAVWMVLRVRNGRAPFARTLLRVAAVLGSIALAVAAAIWIRLQTIDTYTNTLPPTLEFELRIPATLPQPDPAALRVELHTDKNVGDGQLSGNWVTTAEGRVIGGEVPLALKTPSRLLVVWLPDQPTRLYRLPLARDPHATATFSAWRSPDHVARGDEQPHAAPPDDPIMVRYRVHRVDEPQMNTDEHR